MFTQFLPHRRINNRQRENNHRIIRNETSFSLVFLLRQHQTQAILSDRHAIALGHGPRVSVRGSSRPVSSSIGLSTGYAQSGGSVFSDGEDTDRDTAGIGAHGPPGSIAYAPDARGASAHSPMTATGERRGHRASRRRAAPRRAAPRRFAARSGTRAPAWRGAAWRDAEWRDAARRRSYSARALAATPHQPCTRSTMVVVVGSLSRRCRHQEKR
jgi:hypothetical protein